LQQPRCEWQCHPMLFLFWHCYRNTFLIHTQFTEDQRAPLQMNSHQCHGFECKSPLSECESRLIVVCFLAL
jgi:hypothetical protein